MCYVLTHTAYISHLLYQSCSTVVEVSVCLWVVRDRSETTTGLFIAKINTSSIFNTNVLTMSLNKYYYSLE